MISPQRDTTVAVIASDAGRRLETDCTDAPEEYVARMAGAIVGIELPVGRLQGKGKLGQNRTEADREGMVTGLRAEPDESAHALSELIAARQNRRP